MKEPPSTMGEKGQLQSGVGGGQPPLAVSPNTSHGKLPKDTTQNREPTLLWNLSIEECLFFYFKGVL